MARVTLQTIADQLGVSRMTVSNAFSRPDQLSDDLREKILATAKDLGYVGPDPAARALARGTTGAVGVLLTDSLQDAFTDEVATRFLGAVVEALAPTGLALTLIGTNEQGGVAPARDVAIDGALLYSCRVRSTARDWLLHRKLPLVFVDEDPVPGIGSINVDDRGGARAAAQHLVSLGHRRVGIVTYSIDGPTGIIDNPLEADNGHPERERMLGWLEVLEGAGIKPTVVKTNQTDEANEAALLLLTTPKRPTAILCFSDLTAFSVLRTARDLGLTVPDDLSVVGFDDSPIAHQSEPALTTIHQDIVAKGRLATSSLLTAIDRARSQSSARVHHLTQPTELVVRESTAPPPESA